MGERIYKFCENRGKVICIIDSGDGHPYRLEYVEGKYMITDHACICGHAVSANWTVTKTTAAAAFPRALTWTHLGSFQCSFVVSIIISFMWACYRSVDGDCHLRTLEGFRPGFNITRSFNGRLT